MVSNGANSEPNVGETSGPTGLNGVGKLIITWAPPGTSKVIGGEAKSPNKDVR